MPFVSDELTREMKKETSGAMLNYFPMDIALPSLTAPQWDAIYHVMALYAGDKLLSALEHGATRMDPLGWIPK